MCVEQIPIDQLTLFGAEEVETATATTANVLPCPSASVKCCCYDRGECKNPEGPCE